MLFRIHCFLHTHILPHSRQYEFAHGVSATKGLHDFCVLLRERRASHLQSIVISLDFQGAFDSLWYPFVLLFHK